MSQTRILAAVPSSTRRAIASWSNPRHRAGTMNRSGRTWLVMALTSASRRIGRIGFCTAWQRASAAISTTDSTQVGSCQLTTVPAPKPWSHSAAATLSARSSNSAKVSDRPRSSRTMTASGLAAARRATNRHHVVTWSNTVASWPKKRLPIKLIWIVTPIMTRWRSVRKAWAARRGRGELRHAISAQPEPERGVMSEPGSPVTVRVERAGRLLTITLDRPRQANALDMATARQLRDAVRLIDDGVGCVLLRAEGENFCVGGDVRAFAAAPAPGEFLGELASVVHGAVLGLASAAAPVVAAVNGWAAGAGMSLAACADLTLAAESARFRSAYSAIGLSPDCGLTWTLPRLVGRARAADLMLTNRAVGAAEAAGIGLVARVVADDSLLADAQATAVELASGPSVAFGRIKRLLDAGGRATPADPLDAEAASIAACADHLEGRAGVAAFTAGRKPVCYWQAVAQATWVSGVGPAPGLGRIGGMTSEPHQRAIGSLRTVALDAPDIDGLATFY